MNPRIFGHPGSFWFGYWCWVYRGWPKPEVNAFPQLDTVDLVVDLPFERDFVELNKL